MKNKSFRNQRLVVFLAFALFTLGACSSDDTGQNKNNVSEDVSLSDVQGNGGSDTGESLDAAGDVDDSDAVSGGDDTEIPGDVGTDVDPQVDADPGEEDTVEPDPDAYPEVEPVECAYPSDDENCPAGEFGAGTFLTEFQIVEDSSCCYDFNDNGTLDNFLGSLVGQFSVFPGFGDVNGNIAAAINLGELVYLFEFAELEHPEFDSDLKLTVYEGGDNDDDFGANLVGAGEFLVLPHSYEMPGVPKWQFETARVHGGELLATGGRLRIRFPGMLDEIVMILEKVRVRAKIAQGTGKTPDLKAGGRVWLEQGELAGALDRDTLFSSLNEAAEGCECIQDVGDDGKVNPLYRYNSTYDSYSCAVTPSDRTRCRTASVECQNLTEALVCNFLGQQSVNVDVDTDGDGKPDAFSFGARFSGVGASIIGIDGGLIPE